MDTIKRLIGLMKPYKWRIALAMLLQLVVIASRMVAPLIQRSIVNDVIPNLALDLLGPLCAGLLGLVITRAACTYIRGLTLERVSQSVVFDLRTGLYRHMQELPYQFYDNHRIGEIMSRMTGDIEGIRNIIAGGLVTAASNRKTVQHFEGGMISEIAITEGMTAHDAIYSEAVRLRSGMTDAQLSASNFTINGEPVAANLLGTKLVRNGDRIVLSPHAACTKGCRR